MRCLMIRSCASVSSFKKRCDMCSRPRQPSGSGAPRGEALRKYAPTLRTLNTSVSSFVPSSLSQKSGRLMYTRYRFQLVSVQTQSIVEIGQCQVSIFVFRFGLLLRFKPQVIDYVSLSVSKLRSLEQGCLSSTELRSTDRVNPRAVLS